MTNELNICRNNLSLLDKRIARITQIIDEFYSINRHAIFAEFIPSSLKGDIVTLYRRKNDLVDDKRYKYISRCEILLDDLKEKRRQAMAVQHQLESEAALSLF